MLQGEAVKNLFASKRSIRAYKMANSLLIRRLLEIKKVFNLKTQQDFAKFLGVTRSVVSNIERGTREPSKELLINLASKCNINGHSMEPEIQHQDYVIIKKKTDWLNSQGKVCAVRTGDGISLKRVIHNGKSKLKVLISTNSEYDPIIIDPKHTDVILLGFLDLIIRKV